MEEKKKNTVWIVVIVIFALVLIASAMVNVTILDPQSLNNITISINIT